MSTPRIGVGDGQYTPVSDLCDKAVRAYVTAVKNRPTDSAREVLTREQVSNRREYLTLYATLYENYYGMPPYLGVRH